MISVDTLTGKDNLIVLVYAIHVHRHLAGVLTMIIIINTRSILIYEHLALDE